MVAYLFAGQGSQYIGMGKGLYESFPEAKVVFDKADEVLGFSLSQLMFSGSAETLKLTVNAQPAILTATIAAYEAFKIVPRLSSIVPRYMAGLSLGEYSALVASGALTFSDGLKLVKRRAQLMEEASRKQPGSMAAVLDLALEKIKDICAQSGAEIANMNAPGQVVISGRKDAVEQAGRLCEKAGAKRVIALEVSGAFHSSLMLEASQELNVFLKDIPLQAPGIPVISNYTSAIQSAPALIKENLIYQMYNPVRWEESMKFLLAQGIINFIEFGPGRVLKGLMRKIDPAAEVISIEKKEDIDPIGSR